MAKHQRALITLLQEKTTGFCLKLTTYGSPEAPFIVSDWVDKGDFGLGLSTTDLCHSRLYPGDYEFCYMTFTTNLKNSARNLHHNLQLDALRNLTRSPSRIGCRGLRAHEAEKALCGLNCQATTLSLVFLSANVTAIYRKEVVLKPSIISKTKRENQA
jgi:hypothetical protein